MGQIYNHLSNEERNFIQRHLNLGQSCRWIAGRLKRSPHRNIRVNNSQGQPAVLKMPQIFYLARRKQTNYSLNRAN